VAVSGLTNVIAIAAGVSHSLAVKSDGSVWSWGLNTGGQLGIGNTTTTSRSTADTVPSLGSGSKIIAVAAGAAFSMALSSDGAVWTWGLNGNGQLGDGTLTFKSAPVQVIAPVLPPSTNAKVVAIAAGGAFSLALKSDGTLLAWGANSNGQLGDGTTTQKLTPTMVPISNVIAIAAGNLHSLAVQQPNGTLLTWGMNSNNQLGDGGTTTRRTSPFVVGTGFINVAGGAIHSLALKADHTVWSWGNNSSGQLGDGTLENRNVPVSSLITGATAISGGNTHSIALAGTAGPSDATAPVITSTVTGTLGNNGWYRSNVTVTWTITDPESSISSVTGCSTTNITTETTGTVLTCSATNSAGLTASASVTIKMDKTPPDASFTRTAANAAGWNKSAVNVHFTATDNLSGLVGSGVVDQNITTEGQNQSASATFTDLAGNTVTISIGGINIDLTPPTVQFAAPSPAPNAAGWNNTDVQMGFTVTDNLSGVVSPSSPGTLTFTAQGSNLTSTLTVTDAAGNSATVTSPVVKIDKTAPVVTFTRTAPNAAGWNNSAVVVHFTATDGLSGINGAAVLDQTITTEGQNQSATATFTDAAGNSASATATGINIDTTPPTILFGAPSPAPNAAGWNKTNVSISFTTVDNLSGVVSPVGPGALTLSTEGSSVKGTVIVTDAAGNSATFTSPAVKIDKTAPVATATAWPAPDASGWNSTDVTVTFSGTDNLSGIASCSAPVVLSTNGANQSSTPGTCTDFAGNVSAPVSATGINIIKPQPPTPTGPVISGMPAVDCRVWPMNKQMVKVADIHATDPSGIVPGSFNITVTANEPLNSGDVVITNGVVQLRAFRQGNSSGGRIYTIVARASSVAGGTTVVTGQCTVPHDSGH
jgi:alpha-tubulin suppressor-like RCC1 family protein